MRCLLAVEESGSLRTLHVRIAAEAAGVPERTVWRWLSEGRGGRIEVRSRRGGLSLSEGLWAVLGEVGGNVAALHRRLDEAETAGRLGEWGLESVPSVATLHRVVRRDLRAGRVLEIARQARTRIEPSRYDRALAELRFTAGPEGPLVLDSGQTQDQPQAGPETVASQRGSVPRAGGVRLYVPGARLVSTRQLSGVVEAVGHTVAARGVCCVYGDTGYGKTVAVQQALHMLPARTPVWRAVVAVKPGLPQLRAALLDVLGLPAGVLTLRAGAADRALAEALGQPGVLFLDDVQRLTPLLLDYLRQLWEEPGTVAALVSCGAGSERAVDRAPALRSRVSTWHQVDRMEKNQVPDTLQLFHPVWDAADPADLAWADASTARGNFRTWAKITSHVYAALHRSPGAVDRALLERACTRLGPYT
ncbi:AAA family ATPase [Streptomyces sp. NPDC056930]|uniref:AAA family ATPase n=1 Tax=Streptomyces sp. NPDC056930 TaxID=3345967 RepID=UPI003645B8A3